MRRLGVLAFLLEFVRNVSGALINGTVGSAYEHRHPHEMIEQIDAGEKEVSAIEMFGSDALRI